MNYVLTILDYKYPFTYFWCDVSTQIKKYILIATVIKIILKFLLIMSRILKISLF